MPLSQKAVFVNNLFIFGGGLVGQPLRICGDFARGDCTRDDLCKISHEYLKKTLLDDLDAYTEGEECLIVP